MVITKKIVCWGLLLTRLLLILLAVITVSPLVASASNVKITINTYSLSGMGSVNTHWLETEEGIIVIDGQRSLSAANKALTQIKKTNKPIIGIFNTHAHPDHFGGIRVFADSAPKAAVYASPITHEQIKNDTLGYIKASREVVGDDFPQNVLVPNQLVEDGDRIKLAGVEIYVRELGPNEASSMTLFHIPQAQSLFSGDLIANGMTPFLLEGHTSKWIKQLKTLSAMFPNVVTIYPGHGSAGAKDLLINKQLEYLTRFRELVADSLSNDGQISSDEKNEIIQRMNSLYPGYKPVAEIPDLLERNINTVANELSTDTVLKVKR
ncbi:MBL fold metallo-hydrolase [Chroococcidiopsis sp. CCMEE 29]|uniref:MBL fold metallo-hydrolase n=1 Tax=Chroococcidiopsis sp. CCMEE 29 TaxID=155894 RepID=UPI002020C005|nr:MBL fold metallo-hydrolase [Chroococcidiopsis sp. CCMEE 29]